jgi:hypothetical protein
MIIFGKYLIEYLFVLANEGPAARINISQRGLRKVTSGLWGTLDEFIVTGHDNGELVQWDIKVDIDLLFLFFQSEKKIFRQWMMCGEKNHIKDKLWIYKLIKI